ncbi:NACHT, LRR and PYD domains-containing protein 12-like [Ambystoma mexicanum]|uniref:NACHT, LRR and PYD domains-containing protein 12-like n=1 Tax=Ambystoma mexicanum TaxID=8296 RepID=UPI0037E7C7FA
MAAKQGRELGESDVLEFHNSLSKYSDAEFRRLNQYFRSDIIYVIENVDFSGVLQELCYRKAITGEQAQMYREVGKQCGYSAAASLLLEDMFEKNGNSTKLLWESLYALQRNYSHPNLLGIVDEITENGRNILSDELLNEHGHDLHQDLGDTQKELKDHLFRQTNVLQECRPPGQSHPAQNFPISERYIELVVIGGRHLRKQGQHEALQTGELHEYHIRRKVQTGLERITPNRLFRWCFRSHRVPQSVIVTGVAGVGKTTLMHKFVFDWVQGKHYQKFAYVFFFKCRDMHHNEDGMYISLEQLILAEYPFLKKNLGLILNDPQKLLFIFDGLDESRSQLDLSNDGLRDLCGSPIEVSTVGGIMNSLLRQTLLKGSTVLLTSRPIALEKLQTGILHRSAEIVGFLSKEREEYFSKFYNNDFIWKDVFQYVRDTGILFTLCYNPSYCWITCTALKCCFTKQAGKPLAPPKTITQLFVNYISNVLTNHSIDYDCDRNDLIKIARLADHGVKNRILVFYDNDLAAFDVRATKLLSGFMTETTQANDQSRVTRSFLHLTIQEFWAASLYYLDYSKEGFKQLMDSASTCGDGRYEIFFRFLAGLSHPPSRSMLERYFGKFSAEATREVIKWLNERVHQELQGLREDEDKQKLLDMFSFLFESRNSSLVRETVGQCPLLDLSDLYLTPVDCVILSYILGCCKEIESLNLDSCLIQTEGLERLSPVLYSVQTLSLSNNDLKDAGIEVICNALKDPRCRIQSLSLQKNYLTVDCCSKLASAIKENSTVVSLNLARNKIRNDGLSSLISIFHDPNCRIHTLSLQENGLSDDSVQTLLSISDSGSLRNLDLKGNFFTDACADDMQYFILTCTSLSEIKLGMNDFTPRVETSLEILKEDRPGLDITMG